MRLYGSRDPAWHETGWALPVSTPAQGELTAAAGIARTLFTLAEPKEPTKKAATSTSTARVVDPEECRQALTAIPNGADVDRGF